MQTDKEKTREYSQINHITLLILEQNIPGFMWNTKHPQPKCLHANSCTDTAVYWLFFFFP